MSVPLEEIQLQEEEDGKIRTIQALDPARVTNIKFVSYCPPPTELSDTGQVEEWGNRIGFIVEDLHKLLQMSHDKFWCQAVFDETLQTLIDTYLKNAPRSFDVLCELPEDQQEQHNEVHKLIFKTCLRLATHKEDKEHFISPAVFGEIIYENFLFDVPKLFDICVLFGEGNESLLSKMINNIFTQQPKYNEDLSCVIPTIYQAFEDLKRKCAVPDASKGRSKIPLEVHNGKTSQTLQNLSVMDLQDLIFYIADIGVTVSSFLEVYPTASEIFHQANFIFQLSESYDIVPALLAEVKRREFEDYKGRQLLKVKLAHAKKDLMKIVHLIITKCFIEPILENRNAPDQFVEKFILTLSAVLNERQFLADFEGCYPFQCYSDILAQCSYEIDEARIQYIQDAFSSAFATYGKRRKPYGATTRGGRTSPDGSPGPVEDDVGEEAEVKLNNFLKDENKELTGAFAPTKVGVELDSMIAAVKDLLPELGDGFVELCLEETGYDIEKVINFLLEDKLPQSLQNLDRNLPREMSHATQDSLSQRTSIFDNDEFDVFSKDKIDMSRIHRGKREKEDIEVMCAKDFATVKSNLANRYGYEVVYVDVDDDKDEVYNDEYDDTYDTINVGADDADSADELSQRRQFTMPRVLEQRKPNKDNDSMGSSEESGGEVSTKDEFVENPAIIRQRAEEHAQWRHYRRAKENNSHLAGQVQDSKRDFRGGPKGAGQTGEILKNRTWKEKHKSSHSNHNRKYFSDKKRMGFNRPTN